MTQAIVDPEEVEFFAAQVQMFVDDLRGRLASLRGGFSRLGDTWRDVEHRHFAEEFEEASLVLERFMETAEDHVPFLQQKAQLARDYLQHRAR